MSLLQNHPLSQQQQKAIRAAGPEVVVTAGAGTGKTHTLVGRYLYLLQDGLPLRSIVAITFTRKAAREMRNRIRQAVWDALSSLDAGDAAYGRWQNLFSELDAARIDTIHGFCAEILRSHPVEAGVEPGFEMLDETAAAMLRTRALEDCLAWAADQDFAADLFAALTEPQLRQVLKTLLTRRLDAAVALTGQEDSAALLASWQRQFQAWQAEARQALIASRVWQECFELLRQTSALDPADKLAHQRATALRAMQQLMSRDGDMAQAAADLRDLNLRGGRGAAWPGGKTTVEEVRAALKQVRQMIRDQPLLSQTLGPQDEAWAQLWPRIRQVARVAVQRYEAARRQRRALDFDDLEDRALRVLRRYEHVRRHWQAEIRALLVDEFQDINQRQRDLITYLQGSNTPLFVVGDAKQSIYRFRGADVEVFRRERLAAEEQGCVITLDLSHRSHAALVAWQNAALAPVLGSGGPAWEEPFAPLRAVHEQPDRLTAPPFIEFYLAVGKKDAALPRSAAAVAARLAEWFRAQNYRPDDVAILCRASTSFAAYEDALEQAGIPFITVAGRGFYDRPEVRELLVLLRAAADPEDNIALAGALRSAAIGLSDYALWLLATDARQHDEHSWWPALHRAADLLPTDEQPLAAAGLTLLQRLRALAGRVTVAELLATLLEQSHYLAMLAAVEDRRAQRNIAKLLADAQASGMVQVSEFLEYVAAAKTEQVKEGEAPLLSQGAVQIMTIHKAKGMEFPVVVVGDVGYDKRGGAGPILNDGCLWYPMKNGDEQAVMYQLYRQQELIREDAESRRLLYVAATRAQERLLFSGHWGLSRGRLASFTGWAKLLMPQLGLPVDMRSKLDLQGNQQWTFHGECGGQPLLCYVSEPMWQPSAPTAPQPPAVPSLSHPDPALVKPVIAPKPAADDGKQDRDPPRRVWRVTTPAGRPYAPAWTVGKLVHHALQYWRFPGEANFTPWLTAYARTLGMVEPAQIRQAVQQAGRMLQRLQRSDLGREIAAAELRHHEVPYVLASEQGEERGVIDLLYGDGKGWTLVDFKTDRLRDETAMRALLADPGNDYLQQLQRYAAAMSALLAEQPRALLCFLNVGGGVAVVEVAT